MMTVTRLDGGWAIWDGFAFEPDATVYHAQIDAQTCANQVNAEAAAWERAGLADAPHLDNF